MQRKLLSLLLAVLLLFPLASCHSSYEADDAKSDTEESYYSSSDTVTEISSADAISSEKSSSGKEPSSSKKISSSQSVSGGKTDYSKIPAYSGKPYVVLNNNKPVFSKAELTTVAYEKYSPLDSLGRCGVAIASCGTELMPTGERGSISNIYPTGWRQAKYDSVSGKYLYNRCHLIGWQLSGENANNKNLITGTRYMNTAGMLPFENMVADYIKETDNHVAYRITPIFRGNNLLCSGVQMEAYSIEDDGEGICFNVYCYNVQPDITINYATGASSGKTAAVSSSKPTASSKPAAVSSKAETDNSPSPSSVYILNTNSKKIHYPHCGSAKQIADKNRQEFSGNIDTLFDRGYTTCGNCFK